MNWSKIVPYIIKYAPMLVQAIIDHKKEEAAKSPATPDRPGPA